MSVEPRKSKMGKWGCLVCKNLKNSTLQKKCSICGAKRELHRFAFSLMEVTYLCHVNTARAFPQVTITRMSPPESTTTVQLPSIQESLLDAVMEAVTNVASKIASSESQSTVTTNINESLSSSSVEGGRQVQEQEPHPDQRLDLYHKVMQKAKDLEYDSISGQFVPTGAAVATDLNYVQSMQKQKDVMDKIVQDTILSRVEEAESPHKDINASADNLNEWKAKVPCALCGYHFPPSQLLGNISNHSILNWLKEHKASTDSKEYKKMTLQAYEAAKMCLFCTQFFDENYTDIFEVEMSANEEFRSRRKEDKKHKKKESKEDKVIAKLNEKLSIAELKTKKETIGIRLRGAQEEEVVNAEQIVKLQNEKRSMKFQEAKEKFRLHKASLSKKTVSSRTQATDNLPSLDKKNKRNAATLEDVRRSKEGNFTSRSAGSNSDSKKQLKLKDSSSDSKLLKARNRNRRQRNNNNNNNNQNITSNTTSQKQGSSLPSIIPKNGVLATTMESEDGGDLDSVASLEASIDSIEEALHANNSLTNNKNNKKKKKKIKKKNKDIIPRMTKKETSRLELLKEIAEKKVKEEKRYKSRKLHRKNDWSDVRVGNGGEEKDMKIFRDQEKRAAALIEEYEREVFNQQESPVKCPPENIIDRPGWDSTSTVVQKISNKHVALHSSIVEERDSDDDEYNDKYDDEYDHDEEEEDEDIIVAEEKITQQSSLALLKPTISLEMIQQHKQHLQAMHLKHLETHIDNKNLEEQSRPLTKDAPIRTSITKDMLDNHKKHVLSMKNKSIVTVTNTPVAVTTNIQNKSKLNSQNVRSGAKAVSSSVRTKPSTNQHQNQNQNRNRTLLNASQHPAQSRAQKSSTTTRNHTNTNTNTNTGKPHFLPSPSERTGEDEEGEDDSDYDDSDEDFADTGDDDDDGDEHEENKHMKEREMEDEEEDEKEKEKEVRAKKTHSVVNRTTVVKKKPTAHRHDDMDDVSSQVMDDDDVVTLAMNDYEIHEEEDEAVNDGDGEGEETSKSKEGGGGIAGQELVFSSSLKRQLSTIASQDSHDEGNTDNGNVIDVDNDKKKKEKKKKKGDDEEDDNDEEAYHGFDSFMDSLQVQALHVEHSHIDLLHHENDNSSPSSKTTKNKNTKSASSRRSANVCGGQDNDEVDDVIEDESDKDKDNGNGEALEICEEVLFDDEDDTPYDVDLYSAVEIRCSPVTVTIDNDNDNNNDSDIEDEVDSCSGSRSHVTSAASSPSKTHLNKQKQQQKPQKQHQKQQQQQQQQHAELRGIELLGSASSGQRNKQLSSPGGSRGGVRKAGKSNRLEPYDNSGSGSRPTSTSTTRSLRPLSRSTLTSSGSVRVHTSSGAQKPNRLEQYDNSSSASPTRGSAGSGTVTPVKVRTNELESSGQFSMMGLTSPPSSSSAIRRRKRSGATVTKLEVVGKDNHITTGGVGVGGGLKTPDATAVRRRSIGSSSSRSTSRSNQRKPTVNTLEVVDSNSASAGAAATSCANTANTANTADGVNGGSRRPSKKLEATLPSNLEHRDQVRPTKVSKTDNTAGGVINYDSKLDQQELGHSRLPHRHETFSKISKKIDETPSMLDLSIMKFNGEVKMKKVDSFARLSRRITHQQQQKQHKQLQQVSLSPTKSSNKVRHTIVNGGTIYS